MYACVYVVSHNIALREFSKTPIHIDERLNEYSWIYEHNTLALVKNKSSTPHADFFASSNWPILRFSLGQMNKAEGVMRKTEINFIISTLKVPLYGNWMEIELKLDLTRAAIKGRQCRALNPVFSLF